MRRFWSHPYGKVVTFVGSSLVLSQLGFSLHFRTVGAVLAIALVVLSGWWFFGHLVTADDDMPGGWSNPEGSRSFWRSSLLDLLVKFLVFVVAGTFAAVNLGL
jgi:hypothetical protein